MSSDLNIVFSRITNSSAGTTTTNAPHHSAQPYITTIVLVSVILVVFIALFICCHYCQKKSYRMRNGYQVLLNDDRLNKSYENQNKVVKIQISDENLELDSNSSHDMQHESPTSEKYPEFNRYNVEYSHDDVLNLSSQVELTSDLSKEIDRSYPIIPEMSNEFIDSLSF